MSGRLGRTLLAKIAVVNPPGVGTFTPYALIGGFRSSYAIPTTGTVGVWVSYISIKEVEITFNAASNDASEFLFDVKIGQGILYPDDMLTRATANPQYLVSSDATGDEQLEQHIWSTTSTANPNFYTEVPIYSSSINTRCGKVLEFDTFRISAEMQRSDTNEEIARNGLLIKLLSALTGTAEITVTYERIGQRYYEAAI